MLLSVGGQTEKDGRSWDEPHCKNSRGKRNCGPLVRAGESGFDGVRQIGGRVFWCKKVWNVIQSWAGVEAHPPREDPFHVLWRRVVASRKVADYQGAQSSRDGHTHVTRQSRTFVCLQLAWIVRDDEGGRHFKDWLRYCVLSWPHHILKFLDGWTIWCNATTFELQHQAEPDCSFIVGWLNRVFFLISAKKRRSFYIATPPSWNNYKPCRTLAAPRGPVLAYKSSSIVNVDIEGTSGKKSNSYLQIAIADRVVMVIMQFLERGWP